MSKWRKWLDSFKKLFAKPDHPIKKATEKNDNKENQSIKRFFVRKRRQANFFVSIFVTTLRIFLVLFILIGFVGFGAVIGIGKAYLDSTPELDVVQKKKTG